MDDSGTIHFVGLDSHGSGDPVDEVDGRLQVLPDGSLHVEYDARCVGMSGALTQFTLSSAVVVVKKTCDCADRIDLSCITNNCNREDPCPQSTSDPKPLCKWINLEVVIQSMPGP